MIISCPDCGYENDVPEPGATLTCDRCEATLRVPRGSRPVAVRPTPSNAEEPAKKGSGRMWLIAIILMLKGLVLFYHLAGRELNPPAAIPAAPVFVPQPAKPAAPPKMGPLTYELFEPEELPPAGDGMRTFSVKFTKLNPANFRPFPFLSIAVGGRRITQPIDPILFREEAGAKTITFSVPKGEIPANAGEMSLRLIADPRLVAVAGAESNAVALKLKAAP